MSRSPNSLRIFCIEDNALLVMQLEMMIENTGHQFAGSAARFDDVKSAFGTTEFDLALVDIDLADGRTGGEIAEWLGGHDKPSLFITGQEQVALTYGSTALGTIVKPVSEPVLRTALQKVSQALTRRE